MTYELTTKCGPLEPGQTGFDEMRELTYEQALEELHKEYKDVDIFNDMLLVPNYIPLGENKYLTVHDGHAYCMPGMKMLIPETYDYDIDGNRIEVRA